MASKIKIFGISTVFIIAISGCGLTDEGYNYSGNNFYSGPHNDAYTSINSSQFTTGDTYNIGSDEENSDETVEISGEEQSQYVIEHSAEIYDSFEDEDENLPDGKSSSEMLAEQYGSVADGLSDEELQEVEESTYINIPEADDLGSNVYDIIKKEIKALIIKNNYTDVKVLIEEYNIGAEYITYIVKCDDSDFYHITYEYTADNLINSPDTYGSGSAIWDEIEYQEDNMEAENEE